jgi:nucleotide-binding universal stress UspA family protein
MRILVATDGSRAGLAALRFGTRLAGEDGSRELTVLTVYASPEAGVAGANGSAGRRQAERILERAAREVSRRGSPPARFELVQARVAEEVPETISRTADRLQADLVVVGSEGRDSLTEWVVGGTALRLIYVARRPVTVVRAPRRRGEKGSRPVRMRAPTLRGGGS